MFSGDTLQTLTYQLSLLRTTCLFLFCTFIALQATTLDSEAPRSGEGGERRRSSRSETARLETAERRFPLIVVEKTILNNTKIMSKKGMCTFFSASQIIFLSLPLGSLPVSSPRFPADSL